MCRPNQSAKSNLSNNSGRSVRTVGAEALSPTRSEKPLVTMDIKDITSTEDLDALKVGDPFMYYSIPLVKEAKMRGGQEAYISMFSGESKVVTRKTRISFECHPDEFMEELMAEIDGLENEQVDGNDDLFEQFFSREI